MHELGPVLRLLHLTLAVVVLLTCASCGGGDDGGGTQAEVLADDIPIAHTPPNGYGETFPAPILARCTEPLVAGAPDLRGTWGVVSALRNGAPVPASDPVFDHVQRIEQCGNRLVVTAGGVIHDMRCDGTPENGVNDVAADFRTPITVVATYEDGVHVLRPVGIGVEVTRHLEGDELVWNYLNLVVRLRPLDSLE